MVSSWVSRYKNQVFLFLIFVLLLFIFTIVNPHAFLNKDIYFNVFRTGIPTLLMISAALTLVVISGEIDISVGSVFAFSSLFFALAVKHGVPPLLSFFITLLVGFLIGSLNGLITTMFRLNSLIVTLAAMLIWRGVVYIVTGGVAIFMREGSIVSKALTSSIHGFPVQILWAIALTAVYWFILNRTKFGNWIYCTGDDEEVARKMGIKTQMVKVICFGILGITCAFAAVMSTYTVRMFYPLTGEDLAFTPVAVVALSGTPLTGGVGSLAGTLIGAFIMGFLDAGVIAMGFSGFHIRLLSGIIIIISLVFHKLLSGKGRVRQE